MSKSSSFSLISLAVAIFSMFFGAGNAIFPLILGKNTQDLCGIASLGLFCTGILGPILGLATASLYQGKIKDFFYGAGKWLGGFLMIITLALLGPFAVLPRCLTVAHAAFSQLIPDISTRCP